MEKETKNELRKVLMVLQLMGDNNVMVRKAFDDYPTIAEGQNLGASRGWNKWIESLQDNI